MEYKIIGESLPVVLCKLNSGEKMVTQAGGMSWHTQGITVSTEGRGGLGGMMKRSLTGESMFQNVYEAHFDNQEIAFASTFPGNILPLNINSNNEGIIVQKEAFLASQPTVNTDIFFKRKLGAGFFGGEGFIMIKLTGRGLAFLEIDGSVHQYDLQSGDKIAISTGHLVAMDHTCRMDIEKVGNVKSMLFGGEGMFNTVVHGPGRVYLQSMPLNKLKDLLTENDDSNNTNRR